MACSSLEDALLPCASNSIRHVNNLGRMSHEKHSFLVTIQLSSQGTVYPHSCGTIFSKDLQAERQQQRRTLAKVES